MLLIQYISTRCSLLTNVYYFSIKSLTYGAKKSIPNMEMMTAIIIVANANAGLGLSAVTPTAVMMLSNEKTISINVIWKMAAAHVI